MRRPVLSLLLLLALLLPQSGVATASTEAATLLSTLEVKGRAAKSGYSRAQFPHWSDLDRNGCDSRNETLKRDLTQLVFKAGTRDCKVKLSYLQVKNQP